MPKVPSELFGSSNLGYPHKSMGNKKRSWEKTRRLQPETIRYTLGFVRRGFYSMLCMFSGCLLFP